MASTCSQLLDLCLRGQAVPSALLDECLAEAGGRAFFSIVVERLGDLFDPALCLFGFCRFGTKAVDEILQMLALFFLIRSLRFQNGADLRFLLKVVINVAWKFSDFPRFHFEGVIRCAP